MADPELYGVLKNSVSILVVDDDTIVLNFFEEVFSGHPLYTVHRAATAREAENIIRSGRPLHLCILDLGIDDIEGDEFYLLKKYSKKLPIVIVSGSTDIERGYTAARLGASGMIAKPPDIGSPVFWELLRDVFMKKVIIPDLSGVVNPILEVCCRILENNLPENVSDWAFKANITTSYLRRLWMECFSYSPKHMLFIYKLYKNAFRWFDELFLAENNDRAMKLGAGDFPGYRQQEVYYLLNRSVFDGIRDKNMLVQRPLVQTVVLLGG